VIDPILFSVDLGFTVLTIRWYGLFFVIGIVVASAYAAWYVKRQDEDPNLIWDALVWILISGIVGARIWYVLGDIIGGSTRYLDDPITILYVHQGGLNILGGIMVAALVGWYYTKRNQIDFWLLADALAVGYLIGQAIGRLGNYINQELYGPPTTLPWGISIDAAQRMPPWNDLEQYPLETTRFHPTFAYEIIWNLFFAGVLTYLILKKEELLRPGVLAGSVLMITGVGRALLESYFRPDQPEFFGLGVSTSLIVSIIFALIGLFIVLVKSGLVSVSFMESTTEYKKKVVHQRRPPVSRKSRQKKVQ
jgi:phosphatidylglycerol:prolipoprotein diacylglycerol transferase